MREAQPARAQRDFDDAVQLLELPAKDPSEERARRQALGAALVERASHRATVGKPVPSRGEGPSEAQQVVERLAALRERAPDDVELQLAAGRAAVLWALALESSDVAAARAQASAAAVLAREVVSRRPDRPAAAVLVVRATLLAGRAQEALVAARGFESRGVLEVSPLVAEAALFAGDFELARTQAV